MKKFLSLFLILSSLTLFAQDKPNVIYISPMTSAMVISPSMVKKNSPTPNIDKIGSEGLKFDDHYSGNTVCSPSRAVLMTGQHSGRCYIRGNMGEGGVHGTYRAMTVLPEIFKAAGYATGGFGKWGLGITSEEGVMNPLNHGFDTFVGLQPGHRSNLLSFNLCRRWQRDPSQEQ